MEKLLSTNNRLKAQCYLPIKCKIDSRLKCNEIYKAGKGVWDTNTACLKCEIFIHSKQRTLIRKGDEKPMAFNEVMDKKVEENPDIMSVTELPDKIYARVVDWKFKVDARGNEALFIYLLTDNKRKVIQKYTSSSYAEVKKAMDKAGGMEVCKHTMLVWKKCDLGQMKKPRLLPIPDSKKSDIKKTD